MTSTKKPAAFIDRDGTLIDFVHYIKDPDLVSIPSSVISGLHLLRDTGYHLVLVSNQSGISRSYYTEEDVQAVHQRMCELLEAENLFLDAYYYCPHAPEDNCRCRKPAPGMLEQACKDLEIDQENSFMAGDYDTDMILAKNFNIPGLLIDSDRSEEKELAQAKFNNFQELAEYAIKNIFPAK